MATRENQQTYESLKIYRDMIPVIEMMPGDDVKTVLLAIAKAYFDGVEPEPPETENPYFLGIFRGWVEKAKSQRGKDLDVRKKRSDAASKNKDDVPP